ncbi:LpqB family beta-propeller domain-containing protein [Arcanobacterium ihumii]|uniref:LpqB family beta-propeller domain-containing protein n=1 Tax=Arcanobacterium ihumii TaxID=2138162 RepID=UPI000F52EC8C|nr:LpqB family beta-propeller domain-containing protein [Arcanobacterium ihumii]
MNRKFRTVLCSALFLLAACSGSLPTTGAVHVVEDDVRPDGGIVLNPKGPSADSSPEELVEGFMRASSVGNSDDFVVARQYLTPEAAARWNPTASVRVFPDSESRKFSRTPTEAVRVSVKALGSLDAEGRYAASPVDSIISNEFTLMLNSEGQWRIAVLDDGISMPQSLFVSLYVKAPLYFLNLSNTSLVADIRWYPRQEVIAQLAKGLVKGPSPWLNPAVHSAIPLDLAVENVAVSVEDSVAKIDLSSSVASLSEGQRALIETQFFRTLTSTGLVQQVELTSGGAKLAAGSRLELPAYPYATAPLAALVDGVPAQIVDGKPKLLSQSDALKSMGLSDLAVSYSDQVQQAVALSNSGTQLQSLDFVNNRFTQITSGKKLIPPSYDSYSWVWTGESDSAGDFGVYNTTTGANTKMHLPEVANSHIRSVRVSREGSRMIVVYDREGATLACAVSIVRDGSGTPISLGDSIPIVQRLKDIVDVAWISESKFALIAKGVDQSTHGLYIAEVGGPSTHVTAIDGATELTGGRGRDSIVLLDQKGTLYEYLSGVWRVFAQGYKSPALPG